MDNREIVYQVFLHEKKLRPRTEGKVFKNSEHDIEQNGAKLLVINH